MAKITPEIIVSNMEQSTQFYTTLGFTKTDEGIVDEHGSQWNSMAMGDASLWLLRQDIAEGFQEGAPRGNGTHLYLTVDDVDALYESMQKGGLQMNIIKEIETLWYGLRQFSVTDPDGYLLVLNTPVDQPSTGEQAGAAVGEG